MPYTCAYTIWKPHLKNERGQCASYNKRLGNFTYQYEEDILKENGLHAVSFNFFVLGNEEKSDGTLNPEIWMKREITIRGNESISVGSKTFDHHFWTSENPKEVQRNLAFFQRHQLHSSYMLIKDLHGEFELSNQSYVAIQIQVDAQNQLKKDIITLDRMEKLLIAHSNGKFRIKKPLSWYETDLEHVLAIRSGETGALFPGDCDMILYDDDFRCRYILEFKKCTERGNVLVKDQSFLTYIKNDRSKYLRLHILRRHLEKVEGRKIPLITVFYPTTAEDVIKLESIDAQLRPGKAVTYQMEATPRKNQQKLLRKIRENF